jgi:hypothetical protein
MNTQPDSKLLAALEKLPRRVEPGRDLWPGIVQSIEQRRRPRPRPAWAYAMAASLMIGVGAAGMWFALSQRDATQPGGMAQVTAGGAAGGDENAYFAERAAYAAHSVETAPNLAPATRTVILNNLRIIETSIGQIQQALAKDPSNPQLQGLLLDLYQDESRLLAATQNVQMQHDAVRTSL